MNSTYTPLIEISNIVHLYKGMRVLDVAQLSFDKGKVYAVLGPNGSGKTTLLNILGVLLKPTKGTVYFEGKDVYASTTLVSDIREKMTTVIQNPVLFDTTVEKNIAYGLAIRGVNGEKIKSIVAECLSTVRLEGFQKRKARLLSGGEAQRVAIARALAIKPQVLFLDEFTSNVDEKSIEVLENVIKTINKEYGSTVFLVTHDTQQAYRLADEVVTLFEGKVIASSLENLFRGKVKKVNDISVFDTGKITIEVVTDKEGMVYAAIDPRDIILSLQPISSSARNSFFGEITRIVDEGSCVSMTMRAGEEFKVKITRESFLGMKLGVGSRVCLTFKSTAVEVF